MTYLKRSEKKFEEIEEVDGKIKAGEQAGHKGKTKKRFNRVDCLETRSLKCCPNFGHTPCIEIGVSIIQTARLVEQPIEIVEYQQQECQFNPCEDVVWEELL